MTNNNFLKKTGLYLLGNLSSKFLSFFLVPIYAFYLSPEDFGSFDFTQTIMFVFVPIAYCAIWEGVLRFLLLKNDDTDQVITTTLLFSLVVTLLSFVLAYILKDTIEIYLPNYPIVFSMFPAYSFAVIWQYYARGLDERQAYVVSSVVSVFVNFIIVIVFLLVFDLGVYSLYFGFIFGQISVVLTIERKIHIFRKIKIELFNYELLKKILVFSLPLVSNLVSLWVISGFGRVLIATHIGKEANGLYAFANKFSVFINVLGSVVSMALIEESILKSKEEDLAEYFSMMLNNLFYFFQSLSLLLVPAISIFYSLIDNTVYFSSLIYVPLLILYAAVMSMSTNVGSSFQALNKTQYIFITTLIGGMVTIIISFLLIGKYGVYGVVVAQLAGAFTMLLGRVILVNYFIKLKINYKRILFLLIIYVVTSSISIKAGLGFNLILTVVLLVLLYALERNLINRIFKQILNKGK